MGMQRGGQCPCVLLKELLPASSPSWKQKVLVSWEDAGGGSWAHSFPLQAVTLPSTLLFIRSTWGHPSLCELWSSAVALHWGPGSAAPRWEVAAGAAGSGCVTRSSWQGTEEWRRALAVPGLPQPLLLAAHTPLTLPSLAQGSREDWDMGCGTWLWMCRPPVRLRNSHVTKRWVKVSCFLPLGSRAMAPSSAPQPQRLSVPLYPTVMCRCAAGDSPGDNGQGAAAGQVRDLMGPALHSFSWVRNEVTWQLRLGLLCLPGH